MSRNREQKKPAGRIKRGPGGSLHTRAQPTQRAGTIKNPTSKNDDACANNQISSSLVPARRWPLAPRQRDGGHELVSAIIANPGVTNSSSVIEFRFFGHQEHAPAAGTIRPADFQSRSSVGVAGELDAHRRISSTAPLIAPQ